MTRHWTVGHYVPEFWAFGHWIEATPGSSAATAPSAVFCEARPVQPDDEEP